MSGSLEMKSMHATCVTGARINGALGQNLQRLWRFHPSTVQLHTDMSTSPHEESTMGTVRGQTTSPMAKGGVAFVAHPTAAGSITRSRPWPRGRIGAINVIVGSGVGKGAKCLKLPVSSESVIFPRTLFTSQVWPRHMANCPVKETSRTGIHFRVVADGTNAEMSQGVAMGGKKVAKRANDVPAIYVSVAASWTIN